MAPHSAMVEPMNNTTPRFEMFCRPVVARDSVTSETSWRYEASEPEYIIDNVRVSFDEFSRRWNEDLAQRHHPEQRQQAQEQDSHPQRSPT